MKTLAFALFLVLSVAPTVTVVYTLTETTARAVKLEAARALTAAADREAQSMDETEGGQR